MAMPHHPYNSPLCGTIKTHNHNRNKQGLLQADKQGNDMLTTELAFLCQTYIQQRAFWPSRGPDREFPVLSPRSSGRQASVLGKSKIIFQTGKSGNRQA
jgi:hypothetical protein